MLGGIQCSILTARVSGDDLMKFGASVLQMLFVTEYRLARHLMIVGLFN